MSIPGAASPLFLATTAGAADAFEISRSLRFNNPDSANLSRTFGSVGNRRTWTWSGWVKRSKIGGQKHSLFGGSGTNSMIRFNNDDGGDNLRVLDAATGGYDVITDRKFRDTSAWYHFVVAVDTTQSTAADRVKIYVNGVQETSFFSSSYPTQNAELTFNNNISHTIGYAPGSTYHEGYLAEINFVDGSALAPTSFGAFDDNGVWQAKEFAGTYGWFDNSQTWSTYGSHSGSTSNTTGSGWQSAFDISPTTYTWSAGGSDLTFTSGIPYTSKVEIYGYKFSSSNEIRVNGSAVSGFNIGTSDTNLGWVTALTGSGNLTSIGSTGYGLVARVRVDGKLLIDSGISVADNSFRLPFTDNSTTQALGYDAAVTAPTLNPRGGMDVVTYSGNGGTQSIGGLAFQPDFVWIKSRSNGNEGHYLYDSVRGANKALYSHATAAEGSSTNQLNTFETDGFTLGSNGAVNSGSHTFVAWAWKAGGAAVSNTDGSLNSQVSANNDYGFSIVSYTGGRSSAGNNTVGHGLSSAPKLVITKSRASNSDWVIQSPLLSANKVLFFKDWAEYDISSGGSLSDPTNSVFSTNYFTGLDTSGDSLIAYCWSEVAGFSKFGSYTGNGSASGPTITTGFKPTYVLIKRTDSSGYHWAIIDAKRGTNKELLANLSAAEGSTLSVSFTSTGFQITNTAPDINGSGGTFIYAAYADRPGNNWTPNNLVAASNPVYSSNNTGNTNSGLGWDKGFNGLGPSGSGGYVETSNGGTGTTLTLNVPFTKLEFAGNGSGFEFNGTSVSISGAYTFTDISSSITSPLTSIKITSLSVLSAVRVDGVILADGDPPSIDSLVDSPSNGTQDDTGVGGEVVGNYCTPNPLNTNSNVGFSDGNLNLNSTAGGWYSCYSTMGISSGKFYWEATAENNSSSALNSLRIGIAPASSNILNSYIGSISDGYGYSQANGNKYNNGSGSSYGSSLSVGDIVMVAFDADNGKIWWGKNGTWFASGNPASGTNAAFTSIPSNTYVPAFSFDRGRWIVNMGARAFAYAAPSGYKSLNTANLPTPTIADGSKFFDTTLWSGNATARSIPTDFAPGFVWTKLRNTGNNHKLFDIVRGVEKRLESSTTNAEATESGTLTAFNSDGFSLGTAGNVNGNSYTYVGWAWTAGANSNNTYTVTVSGGKFYIDGVQQPTLTLAEGSTYKFDQADSTNSGHPLRFSTTSDGTHGGGSEYTTGVTTAGTPGSAGAFTQIVIAASAPTLYAYCTNHSGMGFQVNTSDTGGYTISVGGLNSSAYDQSQTWSSFLTTNAGSNFDSSGAATKAFDDDASTKAYTANNSDGTTQNTSYIQLNSPTALSGILQVKCDNGNAMYDVTSGSTLLATNSTGSDGQLINCGTITNATKIRVLMAGGSRPAIYQMFVNGKLLLDSGVTPSTSVPSIASQVMASPESGFSIVKWTATNGSATIGHGLNAAPEMILVKDIDSSTFWQVYHSSLGNTKAVNLNSTNASSTAANNWNNTSPTSSVFSVGLNSNYLTDDHIAYCFTPVAGYSAMGSYVGNGSSSGPMVFTGFRPKFLLMKSAGAGNWVIIDSARDTYNIADGDLYPDETNAEGSNPRLDILSNGFKLRSTYTSTNPSGTSVIYIAFAENPFQSNGGLAR